MKNMNFSFFKRVKIQDELTGTLLLRKVEADEEQLQFLDFHQTRTHSICPRNTPLKGRSDHLTDLYRFL